MPYAAGSNMSKHSFFCLSIFLLPFLSCAVEEPAAFSVYGSGAQLIAYSKAAVAGTINFKKHDKLEYNFIPGSESFPLASLEIEYSFSGIPSGEILHRCQLVFESEGEAWLLPLDLAFVKADAGTDTVFHYAIPVPHSSERRFSISLRPLPEGSPVYKPPSSEPFVFQIHSLELKGRWFGFYKNTINGKGHVFVSPFVYAREGEGLVSYLIDPPADPGLSAFYMPVPYNKALTNGEHYATLSVDRENVNTVVLFGEKRITALPAQGGILIEGVFFPEEPFPIVVSGPVNGLELRYSIMPLFPRPIAADPGLVLQFQPEKWRDRRYEVFRWDRFPSLLIFDTADYAVQSRLFKRLAFFVEKAGFRGRLSTDEEIAELHGWNAHDYKADDLAVFYETARLEDFPLLREEIELREILLSEGIIRTGSDGQFLGSSGGIISVSRESPAYLRSLFMAHEGYHGLFFIDGDFRDFSRERWASLPRQGKTFITSYFDYQRYDIKDEYLMLNEFMAHILQQPASRAPVYFGETLPRRVEAASPWRRPALGEKDEATNSYPRLASVFLTEAQAFTAYVNRRWGLSGGRVWLVQ